MATLIAVSDGLSVPMSGLFEMIAEEEREMEVMKMSKDQITQINIEKT